MTITIEALNKLSVNEAYQVFSTCCSSDNWILAMVAARPFTDELHLHQEAIDIWKGLNEVDYLQAFEGHPKIGDVNSLRKKYASTKRLASHEQSSVNNADEETLFKLSQANNEYLNKFGFIFIVYATGKSAEQMLDILNDRLFNDRNTEIHNAAIEQSKITELRLDKLLGKAQY